MNLANSRSSNRVVRDNAMTECTALGHVLRGRKTTMTSDNSSSLVSCTVVDLGHTVVTDTRMTWTKEWPEGAEEEEDREQNFQ